MHFSSFVTLGLFGFALAAPAPEPQLLPKPQDTKKITGALSMVQKSIDGLDTAVKAVNSSDIAGLAPLATKATAIGPTIQMAMTMINGAGMVGITDALQISNTASGLSDSLNTLSTDLISKKGFIQQAGLSGTVVSLLQQQQGSSMGLVKAVTGKLPALAQPLAQQQTAGITDPLNKVIQAFSQNSTTPAAGAAPAPAAGAAGTGAARLRL